MPMEPRYLPGTDLPFREAGDSFFRPVEQMIVQAGGFSLAQLCALTGLEGTTIQNWVKRGWVPKPVDKKYFTGQAARVLIISALREGMKIEWIAALMDFAVSVCLEEGQGEARLYDLFCRTICGLSVREGLTEEKLVASASAVLDGYWGERREPRRPLCDVLVTMAVAYFAARLQRRAEECFQGLHVPGTVRRIHLRRGNSQ